MSNWQWLLEILLVLLLAATLFHSVRLERALAILRRDRATFDTLIGGFCDSTRLAEDGAERLRLTAQEAGEQISKQTERACAVRDDLSFLVERGEKAARSLEHLVRQERGLGKPLAGAHPAEALALTNEERHAEPPPRSKAERDLLRALRIGQN